MLALVLPVASMRMTVSEMVILTIPPKLAAAPRKQDVKGLNIR